MSRVLVVDDDELSRNLLELILLDAGHTVQCAGNGSEALQTARTSVPDLIIADVLMPLTDGFELCRLCKQDPALRHVPIILCSGDYTNDQEKNLGLSLGASRYLLKPSSRETMLAAVGDVLQENSRRAAGQDEDATLDEQMQLLRSYNEALFHKLESKMQQLQRIIIEHQKSEETMKRMQTQIIQQEKMASIGQLAAGVAHEINNPMGFISSNLTTLAKYTDRLEEYITTLQKSLGSCPGHPDSAEMDSLRRKLKVDYIISDLRALVNESLDGASRVHRIVQNLKSFSRIDQVECCLSNVNELLESTINIAWNELKYVATLERDFGDIPEITCYPQQLNQVFLNLLVNAVQAIEKQGAITVRTWCDNDCVLVSVSDTGKGIPVEEQKRVFEPFYTTKEAGKGTGLGLSISADIVLKHGGKITVESQVGVGTVFTVGFPLQSPLPQLKQSE